MSYKAGDPVWAVCDRPDFVMVGIKAGTVIGPAEMAGNYWVDIEGHPPPIASSHWTAWERDLRPRRDDPGEADYRQVVAWDKCDWQPRERIAC